MAEVPSKHQLYGPNSERIKIDISGSQGVGVNTHEQNYHVLARMLGNRIIIAFAILGAFIAFGLIVGH